MWVYNQTTGELRNPAGGVAGVGYSGAPGHVNVPGDQDIHNQGPIPTGTYTMLAPVDSATHGPEAIPLLPNTANAMYGRSGFMVHGDSRTNPGCASEGCIIMGRPIRDMLVASADRVLEVVSGTPPDSTL